MSFTPNQPPFYTDGDFTVATAVSKPRLLQPFAGDNGEYILDQDFMQFVANFSALALSTPYPTAPYTSYYLTSETPLVNLDNGIVKWTRRYCQIPASRSEPSSATYQFVGYAASIVVAGGTTTINQGRPRFSQIVPARVQHDYFLIAAGQPYTTENAVPVFQEQAYYLPWGNTYDTGSTTTYTPFYPITNQLQAQTGLKVDFLNDVVSILGTSFSGQATVPSLSQYIALLTLGTPLPLQSGTGCLTGEIINIGSTLNRWQGSILDRATTYILAQ